jgi:hypothetical protein
LVYATHATKEFTKDFAKLDHATQERIRAKIGEVAINPTRYKQYSTMTSAAAHESASANSASSSATTTAKTSCTSKRSSTDTSTSTTDEPPQMSANRQQRIPQATIDRFNELVKGHETLLDAIGRL